MKDPLSFLLVSDGMSPVSLSWLLNSPVRTSAISKDPTTKQATRDKKLSSLIFSFFDYLAKF